MLYKTNLQFELINQKIDEFDRKYRIILHSNEALAQTIKKETEEIKTIILNLTKSPDNSVSTDFFLQKMGSLEDLLNKAIVENTKLFTRNFTTYKHHAKGGEWHPISNFMNIAKQPFIHCNIA